MIFLIGVAYALFFLLQTLCLFVVVVVVVDYILRDLWLLLNLAYFTLNTNKQCLLNFLLTRLDSLTFVLQTILLCRSSSTKPVCRVPLPWSLCPVNTLANCTPARKPVKSRQDKQPWPKPASPRRPNPPLQNARALASRPL